MAEPLQPGIEIYRAAISEMLQGAQVAAQELNEIITNPGTPTRLKLNAIALLFSNVSSVQNWDLEDRFEWLENRIKHETDISQTLPHGTIDVESSGVDPEEENT